MRPFAFGKRWARIIVLPAAVGIAGIGNAQQPPATPASQPGGLTDGWEDIDQRLVFLTEELSSVESSLTAINKTIHVNGYERTTKLHDAENAEKGIENLDRNGGGPVPWQDFYGKTAHQFFYHPRGGIYIDSEPADQRPPQFDYIYRAQARNVIKAEDDAAKLGNKADELIARRRELEAEQSALWCKIAMRGLASRELDRHALYRFDLAAAQSDDASRQHLAGIKAGADFIRRINAAVARVQSDVDSDQRTAFEQLHQETQSARDALDTQLSSHPVLASPLDDPHSNLGQFSRTAKRLADSSENITDAYKLAGDGDQQNDPDRKNRFRGELQRMLVDYASTVMTADQKLSSSADEWKIIPDRGKSLGETAVASATPSAAAPSDAGPLTPERIGARLDRAKTDYLSSVDGAKRELVAAVDRRLSAATDAGDLAQVQSLQAIKSTAETDASIPDDVKDTSLIQAKTRYAQTINAANQRLATAFHEAVRDYTRARDIATAQATQSEFDGSGLAAVTGDSSSHSSGSVSAKNIYILKDELPPYIESGSTYKLDDKGIRPDPHKYLRTTDADFLVRDFTYDIWFIADHKEDVDAWIGIGEGLRTGGGWVPEHSTLLHIHNMGQMAGLVTLNNNGDENGEGIGHLPDTGTFIARVQKHGNTVTFSIGIDRAGTFAPEMSRRIDDIHKFSPYLNDHNAHLFFGNNMLFTQVRLTTTAIPINKSAPSIPVPIIAKITPPAPPEPLPPAVLAAPAVASAAPPVIPPAPAAVAPAAPSALNPSLQTATLKPGLNAEIFNDTDLESSVLKRVDSPIEFAWKARGHPPNVTGQRYGVRWTGVIQIPTGGITELSISAKDGARIFIDGKKLFEFHNAGIKSDTGPFPPGRHEIKLEYWNRAGAGHMKLEWIPTGKNDPETVPASALFHQ
jgi:hypothetical protein